jgi:hypothetical protein
MGNGYLFTKMTNVKAQMSNEIQMHNAKKHPARFCGEAGRYICTP